LNLIPINQIQQLEANKKRALLLEEKRNQTSGDPLQTQNLPTRHQAEAQ
jgi:hypothetical protein